MPQNVVLIVEDEALIAMNVEDIIREMGLRTLIAPTIEEALRLAHSEPPPDLVLLDKMLRGGRNTGDIARDLRTRQIPFIVASGSPRAPGDEAFDGAPFLGKPYPDEELKRTIRELLGPIADSTMSEGAEPAL